jgi:hypothetical protein
MSRYFVLLPAGDLAYHACPWLFLFSDLTMANHKRLDTTRARELQIADISRLFFSVKGRQ